ncbi:MAG: hypothetical protein ACFCUU_10645 [Cyclobacteriaceae bacterium]
MAYSNQISTHIPDKDLKEILDAIKFINDKLSKLVILSKEEKASLPKMKKNTVEFVYDCLKIAEENPETVPNDVDVEEIKKDITLIQSIFKISQPINDLKKKLDDSVILAGSEAYLPSIAIHNSYQAFEIKYKNNKQKVSKV